ncbi:microtubule-associated protein 1B [Platysternon megacephalum]|uniref:Microtubule-associated protein 1B n=1 Tax=Platysternon megacephalum TaxID=55544 RepID=A0A4D9EZF9_9SAUR|nr:microtubule-associated protein 1B [Platysternon megacephalum]
MNLFKLPAESHLSASHHLPQILCPLSPSKSSACDLHPPRTFPEYPLLTLTIPRPPSSVGPMLRLCHSTANLPADTFALRNHRGTSEHKYQHTMHHWGCSRRCTAAIYTPTPKLLRHVPPFLPPFGAGENSVLAADLWGQSACSTSKLRRFIAEESFCL